MKTHFVKVVLVIPVINRPVEISKLLVSLNLLNLDTIDLKVVIIDDGSKEPIDKEVIIPKEKQWDISIRRNDLPMGPGFCRNLASKHNDCDYLWFLDSDTEVIQSNCLKNMIDVLRQQQKVGGVGGTLEPCASGDKIVIWHKCFNYVVLPKTHDLEKCEKQIVNQIATSNLLIRKRDFDLTEGFRVDLSRDEDHEFCLAIKKMGFSFMIDREMVVWHYLSPTGRNSGHFSYFNNQRKYYGSFLRTRVDIMSDHARVRLLFLPVLDIIFLFSIFYFLAKGRPEGSRLKRINDQQTLSRFNNFRVFIFLVMENIKCYFIGYSLIYKKTFNKS